MRWRGTGGVAGGKGEMKRKEQRDSDATYDCVIPLPLSISADLTSPFASSSHRASPVQWFGPKRYTPAPCDVSQLPVIDYVLLSHNHYDHMDSGTIAQLLAKDAEERVAASQGLRHSQTGDEAGRWVEWRRDVNDS
jgi:hypothetical protein